MVAHEIAHQWFYGIVGNDQIKNPWMDEALCRFSEFLYNKSYHSKERISLKESSFESDHIMIQGGDKFTISDTRKITGSLYKWSKNSPENYGTIYEKGSALFYQMMKLLGEEKFEKALREYINEFAYSIVTPKEFKKFWNRYGDFSKLFQLYIG